MDRPSPATPTTTTTATTADTGIALRVRCIRDPYGTGRRPRTASVTKGALRATAGGTVRVAESQGPAGPGGGGVATICVVTVEQLLSGFESTGAVMHAVFTTLVGVGRSAATVSVNPT